MERSRNQLSSNSQEGKSNEIKGRPWGSDFTANGRPWDSNAIVNSQPAGAQQFTKTWGVKGNVRLLFRYFVLSVQSFSSFPCCTFLHPPLQL